MKEHHELTTNPGTYIIGFISRRRAANAELRAAEQTSSRGLTNLAIKAAFYNRMIHSVSAAFKGAHMDALVKELEGAGK